MEIKLSNKKAKEIVNSWELHVENNTQPKNCPSESCPVHEFIMDIKSKLANKGKILEG